MRIGAGVLLILVLSSSSRAIAGSEDAPARRLAARLVSAVVRVEGPGGFFRKGLPASGVLIGETGIVLTAGQRARPGSSVTVHLPSGDRVRGKVIAGDRDLGAAVVRLEERVAGGLILGRSLLSAGEPVLTGGYPFGTVRGDGRPAVAQGVVAQVLRTEGGARYLLTSSVNPGEYGGPVLDRHGRVAGLMHWKRDPTTGLSFAISASLIRRAFPKVPELVAGDPPPADGASDWPVHDRLREVSARTWPSVVSILVLPPGGGTPIRAATGLLVGADGRDGHVGHVMTTRANIGASRTLRVVLHGGRELPAKFLGSDTRLGLALLAVRGEDLPKPAALAEETPAVGSFVVAIGNPNGRERGRGPLLTVGIVGATNRRDRRYGAIHTDAAVNRGNIGGPLVDLEGRVVGILSSLGGVSLTHVGTNSGVGFAIPSPAVRRSMARLVKGESIEYRPGYLGISLAWDPEPGGGVRVEEVLPGRPAARAGLVVNDVIVEADGRPIAGMADARRIFSGLVVGRPISLKVRRKDAVEKIVVTPGVRPLGRGR